MWFTPKNSTHYRANTTPTLTSALSVSSPTVNPPTTNLPTQPLATTIQGQKSRYEILYAITRDEAQGILEQTGITIPFGIGQEKVEDYVIGRGAFGELRIGKDLASSQTVGIKIVEGNTEVEKEAHIQETLTGLPQCMPSLDYVKVTNLEKTTLYQVMPLAGLGSGKQLRNYLAKLDDSAFKEQILLHIAKSLVTGVAAMHAKQFYHLDIKPDNLVVDQDGQVFLIDFGCAELAPDGLIDVSKTDGDRDYISPKRWYLENKFALLSRAEGAAIDLWALGQTLWELATATKLLDNSLWYDSLEQGEAALYQAVEQALNQQPLLREPGSPFFALIKVLLAPNPAQSVTVTEALAHPAFANTPLQTSATHQDTLGYLREFVQNVHWTKPVVASPPNATLEKDPKLAVFNGDNNNHALAHYTLAEKRQPYIVRDKPPLAPLGFPLNETPEAAIPVIPSADLLQNPLRLPPAHFTGYIPRPAVEHALQTALLTSHHTTQTLAITACIGMGGVGKSQLATYLIHTKASKDHYGLRLWFTAVNNISQLQLQYLTLAQDLKLVGMDAKLDEGQAALLHYLETLVEKTGKAWLAVYDNAESLEQLQPYLPKRGGQVLVTSRQPNWPNAIDVEIMTEEEATALLRKIRQADDSDFPLLAKTLGYLPLALAQAGAYLRAQGITASTYLDRYQQQRQALLQANHTLFGKALPHTMTTLLNIEALAQQSSDALTCLGYCALVVSDNIPVRLLEAALKAGSMAEEVPAVTEQSLSVLVKQGLIKTQAATATVSIHRLVQDVVRAHLETTSLQPFLKALLDAFKNEYDDETGSITVQERRQQALIPFIERMEEHYTAYRISTALDPVWSGVLGRLGNTYGDLGDPVKQKVLLERVLTIDEPYYGPDHPQVAVTLTNLANAYGDLGDPAKQKALLERALTIDETYYGPDHPKVAITLGNLANTYGALGDPMKQKALYERVLAIDEPQYGPDHPQVAITLTNLATTYGALGDPVQQKALLERALTIEEPYYGPDHPSVAIILGSLANAYGALGDPMKQKALLERVLTIEEPYYGSDHPEVAITLTNLAIAHGDLGDPVQQKALLERVLTIEEPYYGPDHPKVASTLTHLANAYEALGDPAKAKKLLERALIIKEAHYGSDHPKVAITLENLANAYGALGDPAKAKELLERALQIETDYYPTPDHPKIAKTLRLLASTSGDLGDAKQHKVLAKRALAIFEKHYGLHHPDVAKTLKCLSLTYGKWGKTSQQKDLLARAQAIEESYYGAKHPEVAKTLEQLASVYGLLGHHSEQKDKLEQAYQIVVNFPGYGSLHPLAKQIQADLAALSTPLPSAATILFANDNNNSELAFPNPLALSSTEYGVSPKPEPVSVSRYSLYASKETLSPVAQPEANLQQSETDEVLFTQEKEQPPGYQP